MDAWKFIYGDHHVAQQTVTLDAGTELVCVLTVRGRVSEEMASRIAERLAAAIASEKGRKLLTGR
jgi:hypothetical protein